MQTPKPPSQGPTRLFKNRALGLANGLLWLILLKKALDAPEALEVSVGIWLLAAPPILLLALTAKQGSPLETPAHAALFLLSGAAIGRILGALLGQMDSLGILEILWLPLGIGAVILHYWPSSRDRYRP